VNDIDVNAPSSGLIANITAPNQGGFAAADLAPVLASQNDILVFVHGCANDFSDAVIRAAYNKSWLGQGNIEGVSPDHSPRDRIGSGRPIFGRA
jgi:hypothetical protein